MLIGSKRPTLPTAAGNRLPSEDGIDLNRSCVSSEDNAAHESVDHAG